MSRSLRKRKSVVDYAALARGSDDEDDDNGKPVVGQNKHKNHKKNDNDSSDEFSIADDSIADDVRSEDDFEDDSYKGPNKQKKQTLKSRKAKANADQGPVKVKTEPTSSYNAPEKPLKASSKSKSLASMRERFRFFFGYKEADFVDAVKQRHVWAGEQFAPVKELVSNGQTISRETTYKDKLLELPDVEATSSNISWTDIQSKTNPLNLLRNCQSEAERTTIEAGNFEYLYGNVGYLINVGGTVTSMAWANGHLSPQHQYLAVSVSFADYSDKRDPVDIHVLSEDTRALERNCSSGAIYIYLIDTSRKDVIPTDYKPADPDVKLVLKLSTSFGACHQMVWQPCKECPEDLVGNLALAGYDGRLHLIKVPRPSTEPELGKLLHLKVTKSSLTYELESNILALAWRNSSSVVVGTSDGCIAEFDVSEPQSTEPQGTDPPTSEPSYFMPIASSSISSISTNYPDGENLVLTTSTDGFTRLVDVRDLRNSRASAPRSTQYTMCSSYSCHAKSFIGLEDNYTSKVISSYRMNTPYANTSLTRHEGTLLSLATSLLHPFILTGSTDGYLKIGNIVRRIMVNVRKAGEQYSCAKLWKLDIDYHNKLFRMSDVLEPEKFEPVQSFDRQIMFPPSVAVTSLEWSANQSCGTWYAAGMACGLVRVECL